MHNVTLIPGDGIGPEVAYAVKKIIDATGISISWTILEAGEKTLATQNTPLPQEIFQSIKQNKVALKGPITTPIGKGFRSVNVALRKELNLYANLRPVKSIPGVKTRYENIDLLIVRENTEDLYAGIEHKIGNYAAEAIKLITRDASEKIALFAFTQAKKLGRKKVTAVHKANILKLTDGLFLECTRKIATQFPEIAYDELIIDNCCMQLVQNPEKYDVLVLPNLYGDIVSDLAAGLVGGLGIVPGANIGDECAVFEAVHGSAPDIAGKNIANPLALLQSAIMMMRYLQEDKYADTLEKAVFQLSTSSSALTPDLGGKGTTSSFAEEVIRLIKHT